MVSWSKPFLVAKPRKEPGSWNFEYFEWSEQSGTGDIDQTYSYCRAVKSVFKDAQ